MAAWTSGYSAAPWHARDTGADPGHSRVWLSRHFDEAARQEMLSFDSTLISE